MSSAIATIRKDGGSQSLVKSSECRMTDRRERWRQAGLWAVQAMDDARQHVMNITEAVITMDMDQAQYHREKQGIGHFSLLRLGMMPETFWRAFFYRVGERFNWNMAVMQSVTREETAEEEPDRHLVTMAQSFMVVRRYAKKGAVL